LETGKFAKETRVRIVSEEEKKEELTSVVPLQWLSFAHCEDLSILFVADELCEMISTHNISSVK
jgi:hypothetical protein